MRPIKFRAWDKDRSIMVGSSYAENRGDNKDEFWGDVARIELTSIQDINDNNGFEIMQYTGLKDKRGDNIYEGDLVIHNDYIYKAYEVMRHGMGFCLMSLDGSGDPVERKISISDFEEIYVIGNIYRNGDIVPK